MRYVIFICAYIFKEKYRKNEPFIERITNVFDAIGLGAFAVTGVRVALDSGFGGAFLSITMGMITAIGGGLIRDLMLMETRSFLKREYMPGGDCGCGDILRYVSLRR